MKCLLSSLVFLMVLTLSACLRPAKVNESVTSEQGLNVEKPSPELTAIDSMMWIQADSALAIILEFVNSPEVDGLNVLDGHYCQLLISELLFKNGYSQSNREDLLQAMGYFDNSPQNDHYAFLDARAHYMNGVGYYERDSVVLAVSEYLKALEIMEEHFKAKDLVGRKARFMSLSFNRLGEIYQQQMLIEPGIACFKQSISFCQREPTSIYGISISLQHIGMLYDIANQADSASYYYNEAMSRMPDHDNVHFRDLRAIMAHNAYYSGVCLDSVMMDFYYLISHASDDSERLTRYLTIGGIFLDDKKYDSARFYLETVFEKQEDIESRIVAAEELSFIYQMEGDSIKAHQYASFLAEYTLKEIENKTIVSRIYELFKSYSNKKLEKQAKEERKAAVNNVLKIVVPIALLIALIIFIWVKQRGKKQLKAHQAETEKVLKAKEEHFQQVIEVKETKAQKALEESAKRHEEELRRQQAEVARRIEEKERRHEEEVRRVREAVNREKEILQQGLQQREEQVTALEKALNQQREEAELQREAFLKEPICCKINESIRNLYITAREGSRTNVALSEVDSASLRDAVSRHFDNFEAALLSKNPKMSKDDLQLCQLYLLGLDERQIAVLQCKTYSAIKKRANTLKKMMGLEDSLSTYIASLFSFRQD